jgi:hypothetical protein
MVAVERVVINKRRSLSSVALRLLAYWMYSLKQDLWKKELTKIKGMGRDVDLLRKQSRDIMVGLSVVVSVTFHIRHIVRTVSQKSYA